MQSTPKGLRLQIGVFGRRNTGKSSLLNAITCQDVAVVSPYPGTTADPVEKAMELPPLGPVLFIDTAGLDDDQAVIGPLRVEKSRKTFERCDLALVVAEAGNWGAFENGIVSELSERSIPVIAVLNMCDKASPGEKTVSSLTERRIPFAVTSTLTKEGLPELRQLMIKTAPESFFASLHMLSGIADKGKFVVLVTPIDAEAPRGRMILPQVQAIRDALDCGTYSVVTEVANLASVLDNLKTPPAAVVTDSQAFAEVSKIVPDAIPLTSFSILLARMKGDLAVCAAGAQSIENLKDGDKILMAEACTHHPEGEDIGRVKIPRLLSAKTGKKLEFVFVQGADFPEDLSPYSLVVHCGGCTFNRKMMLSRILACTEQKVAFTNYGTLLAKLNGILSRALSPFSGL